MKRFYKNALSAVCKGENGTELSEDIDSYVGYLKLQHSVLINELSRVDPKNNLLQRLGYRIKIKK